MTHHQISTFASAEGHMDEVHVGQVDGHGHTRAHLVHLQPPNDRQARVCYTCQLAEGGEVHARGQFELKLRCTAATDRQARVTRVS